MTNEQQNYYWIRQAEAAITGEVYWQVHGPGIWLENKNAVAKFTPVLTVAHHNKLTEILVKALEESDCDCLEANHVTGAMSKYTCTRCAALHQYRELSKESGE